MSGMLLAVPTCSDIPWLNKVFRSFPAGGGELGAIPGFFRNTRNALRAHPRNTKNGSIQPTHQGLPRAPCQSTAAGRRAKADCYSSLHPAVPEMAIRAACRRVVHAAGGHIHRRARLEEIDLLALYCCIATPFTRRSGSSARRSQKCETAPNSRPFCCLLLALESGLDEFWVHGDLDPVLLDTGGPTDL
jgi:hypothetical protein